jgi:hypothetical protein
MNLLKISTLIVALLFFLSGCSAKLLSYQPKVIPDIDSAMFTIKNKMESITCLNGIKFEAVTERFIKLQGRFRDRRPFKIVPYKAIGRMTLHTKKDNYIITAYSDFSGSVFRCFLQNEKDAKLLVDALHTMMEHKPNQYDF